MRVHIPTEFARKPRSLKELDRWKATEFRQFLLYTGPIILYRILDPAIYNNFLLLFSAISILVCPRLSSNYAEYAKTLLKTFVNHYADIYGKDLVVYNVHGLIHLPDDVKMHGPLDTFSSFPFENYLQKLKKWLGNHSFLLLRLSEEFQNNV